MNMTRVYYGPAIGLTAMCMATAAAAQSTSTPQSAAPEQTAADPASIGDIIVTAQKRSESVQKIPLAVTAVDGDSLQRNATTTISALGQALPGLNVSEQVGQARLTLRGIGLDNISTGAESSVAFNQDGIFYSRSAAALASFYDVDRVEVLRGPQGTLYGRNATGGSINIITNRPTDDLHGALNLTGGNRETVNADGFINGSLGGDVSGRVSFQVQHHGGYGKNIVTGNDIDNKDSQAVRAQLLIKPGSRFSLLIGADYYKSSDRSNVYHYLGAAGQTAAGVPITPTGLLLGGVAPSSVRDVANAQDPHSRQEFYGARVDASYELSDVMTLRSLSAYRFADYTVNTAVSPFSNNLFPLTVRERSKEYTQELNLNIDTGRNKLVVGAFYLHEDIRGSNAAPFNLLAFGGPNVFVQGFFGGGRLKTDAAAIFAQDTYSITDALRITVGGRYSWERKQVADQSAFDVARPYSPANQVLTPVHNDSTIFRSFTPKLGIDFDVAPRTLAYASFSKGFKSGTYNLGSTGPALRPEKVDAYEAGLKSTFADGKIRANIAAFYYNYSDLQVGKVQGQLVVLENAASARIYGLEGEITARPVDNLVLGVNASWLHARFTSFVTSDQARPGGDGTTIDPRTGAPAFNLAGNTLAQSPNYKIALSADYMIPLKSGKVTLRGESTWSDRVYFTAFNLNSISQAPYSLQNAFVTYEPEGGHFRVSLFVKNIGDKIVLSSANVASTLVGVPVIGFIQPPRTFGGTLGYRF